MLKSYKTKFALLLTLLFLSLQYTTAQITPFLYNIMDFKKNPPFNSFFNIYWVFLCVECIDFIQNLKKKYTKTHKVTQN